MDLTTDRRARRDGLGPQFLLVFTASTISNLGDGVLLAAVPLLARQLTDDPLVVSSVTVAATLPWLLFGLVAGAVVDRSDRRRAMVATDILRGAGLALGALVLAFGSPPLVLVVAMVLLLGTAETIFDTASQAILPSLVPTDQLEKANGRLFGAQIATNGFVGPPLGALLFAVGTSVPFALDAATFVVSALLITRLPAPTTPPPARSPRTTMRREVREGLAWLWQHAGVRAFAVGAAVVNVAHTAAMAIVVLLVRDDLHASTLAFGLVLTGAAIGSIAGALVSSWLVARIGRRPAVLASIGSFSASLLCVGLAPNVGVVAVGLGAFGAAGEVWNVVAVSYRQALVPERLLGRVMATYRVIAYGAMPVGAALGGIVAKLAGVRATFVVGAGLTLALLIYFLSPRRAVMFESERPEGYGYRK